MSLPTHEDIKLFVEKDTKKQHHSKKHHEKQLKATHQMQRTQWIQWKQEEGCWQHKGGTKFQAQDDERNFGDSGYEVTTLHDDCAKTGNGTRKELHVLKQHLKENMNLHKHKSQLLWAQE